MDGGVLLGLLIALLARWAALIVCSGSSGRAMSGPGDPEIFDRHSSLSASRLTGVCRPGRTACHVDELPDFFVQPALIDPIQAD